MRRLLRSPLLFQAISTRLQKADKKRGISELWDNATPHDMKVHKYNRSVGEGKITRTRRAEPLYRLVQKRLPAADVLIVGPRDRHELFLAWTYGAKWAKITGIDLASCNYKILARHMADTKFLSESYDVIVSSATISYLEDVVAGLREMYRILRPGGAFAFTHTYDPKGEWPGNRVQPGQMEYWCKDLGFTVDSRSVTDQMSAQEHPVTVLTCLAVKP